MLNDRPVTLKGKWLFPDKVMLERIEQLYGAKTGK